MNRQTEKTYNRILEKIITSCKRRSRYYDGSRPRPYKTDIENLLAAIAQQYPHLKEVLVPLRRLDAIPVIGITELKRFIARSEKGSLVKCVTKAGTLILCCNAGKNMFTKKNRTLMFSDGAGHTDALNTLQTRIFLTLLQKDIEQLYKKIRLTKTVRPVKNPSRSRPAPAAPSKRPAGAFEASFKRLVRRCGSGAAVLPAAQTIVRSMNGIEKNSLRKTLAALGVKDQPSLAALLASWKEEALSHPAHTARRSPSLSREAG
jgi:hypothetical protein